MRRTLLTLAILSATSAHAQNAIRLDAITVEGNKLFNVTPTEQTHEYTAQAATVGTKIPATLRDIPQSVSIITTQNITDRNVQTFDQLARQTTGLRVLSNDDGRSSVYARGYEYDEYSIDGLPAQMESINGNLPNLSAFDRVEVMRGPSGLFNSTTEMGGVVNFVRKRPTETTQAEITGGLSYPKGYQLKGDVSGAFNQSKTIRGRVLAEGFRKENPNAKKSNHHETLYGALDIDLTPQTTLGLGYLYQQRHIHPDNGLPLQGKTLMSLPNKQYYGANWNRFNSKSHDLFADVKHEFTNGAVGQVSARFSKRDIDWNYAFPSSAIDKAQTFTAIGTARNIQQKAFTFDANYSRPFSTLDNVSEFVIGADYKTFHAEAKNARLSLAKGEQLSVSELNHLPNIDLLNRAQTANKGYSVSEQTLKEAGIYSKLTLRLIPSLAVIMGGRFSHWEIENQNKLKHTNDQKSDKTFTGYAGAVLDIDNNHSLYGSYSSLYRPQTEVDKAGNLLKPRQGQQFEIGIKGSYFGDRLTTRLSAYQLEDKNAAASPANDPKANYRVAIGKRKMRGIEAEIIGEITPEWNISAGYSYLQSHIAKASTKRDDGIFLLMPKHSFNLFSTYALTPEWIVGGGMNAVSHFKSVAGIQAKGYATVDLMARYQINDKFSAQLNLNNAFNRHYYTRVGSANTFNIPGEERNVSATFRYRF